MRGLIYTATAMLPLLTGCNLAKLTAYNIVNEPIVAFDEEHVNHKAVKLAKEAWLEHLTSIPENCPPEAYEFGFMHGYIDYLLKGGNCSPPALPPASLRRKRHMDPEGHLDIRAYYTGFYYGAHMARSSGLRALFIIPVSAPLPREDSPNYDTGREVEKTFPEATLPVPEKAKTGEAAPKPKPMPPLPNQEAPELRQPEPIKPMSQGPAIQPARAVDPSPAPLPVLAPPTTTLPREFLFRNLGGPAGR